MWNIRNSERDPKGREEPLNNIKGMMYSFFKKNLFKVSLPTYSITPSAHLIMYPLQCPSSSYPMPPPPPLLQPFVCFPELGVSHGLSSSLIFPHSVSPLPLWYLPLFLIFHIWVKETIWWLSFSNWLTSLSIIPSSSIHVKANGGYSSFLMAE